MPKSKNWTQEEIDHVVRAYLGILDQESMGEKVNKTAIRKQTLATNLPNRSKGSYEFRCANISTVLESLGLPYVEGYKPRSHVGKEPTRMILNSLKRLEHIEGNTTQKEEFIYTFEPEDGVAEDSIAREDIPNYPLPRGNDTPSKTSYTTRGVQRDQAVKAWVLQNANGVCEGCRMAGPFKMENGKTYLEVHHVVFLSEGGKDIIQNTVALCPNCHARCHYSTDRVQFAQEITERVLRNRPS